MAHSPTDTPAPSRTYTEEVVRGVIRVLKKMSETQKNSPVRVGLNVLYEAGCRGAPEDTHSDILEFIKDGLSRSLMDDVARDDYSRVWTMTNAYLKGFGHPQVEPVPIDPATL